MTGTVLLLDIGNSRVKWALVHPPEWIAEGVSPHDEAGKLLREWDRFPPPEKVIASNVAGEERARVFSAYWQARDVPLHWMQPCQASSGVRNLYDHPEQLGSDRWAALVGARAKAQTACLVVSAGTAVTVDALNEHGEFIGGLILPGKHLMLKGLVAGTHALEDFAGQATDFPRNTADAMASGITTALSSAVQTAFQRLTSICAKPPPCILTGGDADWLANHLQIGVIIAPRLVLEGLLIMATGDDQT
jgi:type III pantothenate kinase